MGKGGWVPLALSSPETGCSFPFPISQSQCPTQVPTPQSKLHDNLLKNIWSYSPFCEGKKLDFSEKHIVCIFLVKRAITPMSFDQIEKFWWLKSSTTANHLISSEAKWHRSRVHKCVWKIVNYFVKYFWKVHMFIFTDNCPWSGDVIWFVCHVPHLCTIF